MRILKPQALKKGDVIGIAAPASPPASQEDLEKGIRYLERLGYRVELGYNIYQKRGYLAGTERDRVSDIHQLFSHSKVKAIFTVRGGYGSIRLLPLLNYSLIKRHPKILVGYSDITALQLAIFQRTGLITFTGPMVASEMSHRFNGEAEEQFWRSLTTSEPLPPIESQTISSISSVRSSTGRLLGGNLSVLSSVAGSRFFPNLSDTILLLEEIDERPYRIDRMLHQLQLSQVLKDAKGIVLGNFTDCDPQPNKPSLSLEDVFRDVFKPLRIPVLNYIHYGHIEHSLTLPLGIRVRIHSGKQVLQFLESALIR